jgi:hypothetical protein
MVLVARTAPQSSEPPQPPGKPGPLRLARAVAVVSAGPLTLAVGSALAPFSAARRWPDRLPAGLPRRVAWSATAVGVAFPGTYAFLVRPRLQHWGSTEEEQNRSYPSDGDDEPLFRTTRAVTVQAPAEEVWRWLVQIGQDRGGFYSYDWLENLAGCRIHSADEIRDDLQHLVAGSELNLLPGYGTRISEVDPPRSLVIENWGAYIVDPVDEHSCRLIARSHHDRSPATVGYILIIELPHAIMERKMLLGIKKRAEAARRSRGT